ncbi:hypothetical protein DH09_08780 [Bacillaceae bacterium JMAK1]|nr:hypothetical protein DH09_08780 [Bacillaceae bacterium JMAK1]
MTTKSALHIVFVILLFGSVFLNVTLEGITAFGFIVPLISAMIFTWLLISKEPMSAYLFGVLAAGLVVSPWVPIPSFLFLFSPLLYVLGVRLFKANTEEIDVDRLSADEKVVEAEPAETMKASSQSFDNNIEQIPNQQWIIFDEEKYKKQAFTLGDETNFNVIFGTLHLDLTRADLQHDHLELSILNTFGDVRIIVPRDWSVEVESNIVMGSTRAFNRSLEGMFKQKTLRFGTDQASLGHIHIKLINILGSSRLKLEKEKKSAGLF